MQWRRQLIYKYCLWEVGSFFCVFKKEKEKGLINCTIGILPAKKKRHVRRAPQPRQQSGMMRGWGRFRVYGILAILDRCFGKLGRFPL